jgi:hypothetical protein
MRAAYGPVILLLLVLAGFWFALSQIPFRKNHGEVSDGKGPVAGARVHYQGLPQPETRSDSEGRFSLPVPSTVRRVTASKEGYTIAAAMPHRLSVRLALNPLPAGDNDDYAWIDPRPDAGHPNNCANCHGEIYREWSGSTHARAADNPHFLNLYAGTDWHGRPSASWNLLAEHPLGAGVCATCHVPTFNDPTLEYDLRKVTGTAGQGVHCDYCHKVVDAPTDKLGTRFGRDGLKLLRPADKRQLFFGPLDDAFREGESFGYSPLHRESRICASCHEGVVFGVHVYGTYSEWLASPARRQGQQCQSCHMTPTGTLTNFAPGKGGIERDPQTLSSHRFPGAEADMLRRCLAVSVRLGEDGDKVHARVEVLADNVGHRVPTGFIDRNLLLVVQGFDADDQPVHLFSGPKLPPTAGHGYAGLPGWLYAKQLKSADGRHPVPFWLAHQEPDDSRLFPGRPDRREFWFAGGTNRLRVRLIYRRFWQEVAESKGWQDNEIVVVDRIVTRAKP